MSPVDRPPSPFDDLGCLFKDLDGAGGLVLAVSGGPDSTALMHLVARWRDASQQRSVWVACVDHGLRPAAAAEASGVVASAQSLGFEGRVLTWVGAKPTRAIQERAREARYALLDAFAVEIGATHLITAHTLDDQAETLLFRMARGSGLHGLAGMRPTVLRGRVLHVRPFLGVPKQTLVDVCESNRWTFVRDPANADTQFARVRWRALLPGLAAEGLTIERLGALADRLAQADTALADVAARAAEACLIESQPGLQRYDADTLLCQPVEIVTRLVGNSLTALTERGPVRLNRLEDLVANLVSHWTLKAPMRRTLHHCLIQLDSQGALILRREKPRNRGVRG